MMRIIQKAEGSPDVSESTTFNPYFGFRHEFRLPSYDPTTICVITLETFDRVHKRVAFVGHAYFPLFIDKNTREPCLDKYIQGFIFNEGMYQIPIYMDVPIYNPPFTWDRVIN